jgi:hypothetical protein
MKKGGQGARVRWAMDEKSAVVKMASAGPGSRLKRSARACHHTQNTTTGNRGAAAPPPPPVEVVRALPRSTSLRKKETMGKR